MKNIQLIIIIFFVVMAWSCQKEAELIRKDYPYVLTHEIGQSDSSGTTFKGEILNANFEEVIEYGFVWSKNVTPTVNDFIFRVFENSFSGNYEKHITYDLIKNIHYNVRAYAKTKTFTVYGNNIPFVSQGSNPPFVDDFFPKIASDGDQITITGNHFTSNHGGISIRIGPQLVKIDSVSSNRLTFTIPTHLSADSYPLALHASNKLVLTKEKLTIANPLIQSFSPTEGIDGTKVIIVGKYFGSDIKNNTVKFGRSLTTIIRSSKDTLEVIVPKSEDKGLVNVTVNTSGKFSSATQKFKIL